MNTPICDFVEKYCESKAIRMHMPGHKGADKLGFEHLDITEFQGADDLYHPCGIIAESEKNASTLFGFPTYYSTEGASQCIRAMMHLVALFGKKAGKKPLVAAGRNAHKTFISAVALLDSDVLWLSPKGNKSYLSCNITAEELDDFLQRQKEMPVAVYITSPDYLGNVADIKGLSEVCHKHGALLAVDNAHGAYLKFLEDSLHPVDLGADICCDSAHKTLPVVTGGAYLHTKEGLFTAEEVKNALALFGSTSPSYLIMQSLDYCNKYLEGFGKRLQNFLPEIAELKADLIKNGYTLYGDEPMKLTIKAREYGYTGTEIADILAKSNIFCEFSDPDYVVLMPTPETTDEELKKIKSALTEIPKKLILNTYPPNFAEAQRVISVREAVFSPSEVLPVEECEGRISADISTACPPAVPILICGEKITKEAIESFRYYGVESCRVVNSEFGMRNDIRCRMPDAGCQCM